ncbi:hypothetical protein PT287_07605 [Lactobacillus sp. ESL0679]|uniref:hypothetical protein n=1 Tax=Lactobacillus sp. ESL0679 TaxID=2983209 RepID=UPI0023F95AF7|nr:hypothetical protein [Lactobacillus sp. ESL0679]MDF7683365.1 hypothetical protein [Lactobacillus sp. ESL0679]
MKKKIFILATALLAATSLTACSSNNNDTQGGTKVSKSAQKKAQPKINYYKIGDTVKVGKVEYTLKSAKAVSERNEFADTKPKNVIKIVYHVKNDSKKDLPIGTDLNVYGPSNTKLKNYPINNNTLDSVAAGKEANVTTGFGTKKLGTFELQFKSLVDFESKAAKFKVTIK